MKRIFAMILAFACCMSLFGCGGKNSSNPTQATEPTASQLPSQPPHMEHTFGAWTVKTSPSCLNEGRAERRCTVCSVAESRTLPKSDHKFNAQNLCTKCYQVDFDDETALVELGVVCDNWYGSGSKANYAWDIKVWNGKVYRAAGDYDKNSGATTILAYDIANRRWVKTGTADDEAIHRFVEIGGTLYTPGIDAIGNWDTGNFYVLDEDGKWKMTRNLPNGLHCFDMIEFDGKIFAGLGTETLGDTVAVSQDQGKTFTFIPLYRDGTLLDTSGYEYSRTYAFVEYTGDLYALVTFKKTGSLSYDRFVFRYEDGKMQYQSVADSRLTGQTGSNYWQGKVEWKGVCYLTSTALNAVTDFSKPETHKQISMPNGGVVSDILVHNDQLYVLSYKFQEDMTCNAVIYKSATGEEGSFTEVASFHYAAFPISFDFDGEHFYVGTGMCLADSSKAGMILRVKPGA